VAEPEKKGPGAQRSGITSGRVWQPARKKKNHGSEGMTGNQRDGLKRRTKYAACHWENRGPVAGKKGAKLGSTVGARKREKKPSREGVKDAPANRPKGKKKIP